MAQPVHSTGQSASILAKGCEECGATDKKLSQCARCHIPRYCNGTCQTQHWPIHQKVCKRIAQAASLPSMEKNTPMGVIACELVGSGQYNSAFKIVSEHVTEERLRAVFFDCAAQSMFKDGITHLLKAETGGQMLGLVPKRVRQSIVEALAMNGYIEQACVKAREAESVEEQSRCLEIVVKILMSEARYKDAQDVANTILDPDKKQAALNMIASESPLQK